MPPSVEGSFELDFAALVDRFADELAAQPFAGASLAVVQDGTRVVDVWGGTADILTGRARGEDTLTLLYSCSKGISALMVMRLVDQGLVDLDAPIATYWPEFAANDKQSITLRQVMSHRAGISMLDAPLTLEDVIGGHALISAIEEQRPLWEPGHGHSYHAVTAGIVVGEVVRRICGRSLGQFLREEATGPFDLDLWLGLPSSQHARAAPMLPPDPRGVDPEVRELVSSMLSADDTFWRTISLNGAIRIPILAQTFETDWNDPRLWEAELPAGNMFATARSVAELYAAAVGASSVTRDALLSDVVVGDARAVQTEGAPTIGVQPGPYPRWGTGFMISCDVRPMLGATSFGHDGAAGALCFADSEARIGFAYLTNQMGSIPDVRANRLVDALRTCLSATK